MSTSKRVSQPIISIVTPMYNAEAFLSETIASVRGQTRQDWEWILLDDGSHDRSQDVIRAVRDQRIELVSCHHCGNPSVLRNRGAKLARGRYLAFLDHDDLWEKEFLAETVAFLEQEREAAIVQANSDCLVEATGGWSRRARMIRMPSVAGPLSSGVDSGRDMLMGNFVVLSATLIRREAFEGVGGFDEGADVRACTDFDLWLKLLEADAVFGFVDKQLASYRLRASSMSAEVIRHLSNRLHVLGALTRRSPAFYAGLESEVRSSISRWTIERGIQRCVLGEGGWRQDILWGVARNPWTTRGLKWVALASLPAVILRRTLSWRNRSAGKKLP